MCIQEGDIVKAYIRGETEGGEIFFSNSDTLPVEFCVNSDFFLKGIEQVVTGMKKGETKNAVLSSDDSFGSRTDELIKIIPRGFHEQDKGEGDTLTYFDYKNKKPMDGIIIEAHPKTLMVDFNHSLCGKTIKYNVEIVDIVKKGQKNTKGAEIKDTVHTNNEVLV
jgi:FKBP-type peptidyl-prolyl cis-trans isomerase 2